METRTRATIEDLYHVPENGKAEIINGKLVLMGPTGARPGRAGGKILTSLALHEEEHGDGYAILDKVGFVVNLPHRKSFSPDVAWHVGDVESMKFVSGAPVFAVEVRSENDYGEQTDQDIADKIRDYLQAGTQVLWDVGLLGLDTIKVYRASAPESPTIYRRSDVAEAESAIPGWTFSVDTLFRDRKRS